MAFLWKVAATARRVRARVLRSRLEDELRDEIAAHLEQRRRQLVDDGMDPGAALLEARRLFGNATMIREEARDMWSLRLVDAFVQDLRFGARLLRRTPAFTAVAVLSLSAGIGSAAAVFNVADAVLFRRLGVPDASALRSFRAVAHLGAGSKTVTGVDEQTFERIRANADFAQIVGFRVADDVTIQSAGMATRVARVELVSGDYFDVLGLRASAGRTLTPADVGGAPRPVVVSERLSRVMDPSGGILGRNLTLNGDPAIVVGVVRGYRGLVSERPADLFAPLAPGWPLAPTTPSTPIRLAMRLHDGVSATVAAQRLVPLFIGPGSAVLKAEDLQVELPDASRGISEARVPLQRPLWLGLALTAVLLLVACANTSGLLLSRFISRQSEFGVRVAIGAGRWRLARQLMVESLLVALCAAAIGLALGWLAAPALVALMPEGGAQASFELRFDRRLVAFTLLLAVTAAGAAATASLLRLWRSDACALLGGSERTVAGGSRALTRALVAAQVACSLLLMVGAMAMGRTLMNLRSVPAGFDLERTLMVTVNASGLVPADEAAGYHERLRQRFAATPGIARATMSQVGLLTAATTTGTVSVPAFTPASDDDRWVRMFFVGPDYFETVGMPLVAGRGISERDAHDRIAVVNDRFASFYFGGAAQAIGQIINGNTLIVGVAADARYNTLRDEPVRAMFVPYAPAKRAAMTHIVRVTGDPAAAMQSVRAAAAEHDPRLHPRIATAQEVLTDTLLRERFFAWIAGVLSVLASLLACAGLYGAVSYGVSQRRAELAVRLALGASRGDVIRLVLLEPVKAVLIGVAAGLPGVYIVMRSAASLLFGVQPFDATLLLLCSVALLSAGTFAALWPARRAARIDPITALRAS